MSRASHLGPPTAPNKMASAALAAFNVSSGSGPPVASIALPPTNALLMLNPRLNLSSTA